MKKLIASLLALALAVSALAGCGAASSSAAASATAAPASSAAATAAPSSSAAAVAPTDIRIAGLKGPTSMGMVKLMDDAANGKAANNYTFTIAGSADEVTPKLTQGELDIAAVPANLAAVLYNNTKGAVQLLAVNTLGVIYIVEKGETVQSLADLKGKTIYATGKGSTPEYALKYILAQNGIDADKDVTIEWKTEPTEVVQMLAQTDGAIAMLPQPFVTVAQTQVQGLRVAIDLNKSWNDLNNGSMFLTGVLVVRTEFAKEHPDQIAAFLKEYQASTEWVNANPADAATLIEKAGIVKAAIAEKALPFCNITYLAGSEMKSATAGYLKVLFDQNPKSVGGTLPGDDFYYGA